MNYRNSCVPMGSVHGVLYLSMTEFRLTNIRNNCATSFKKRNYNLFISMGMGAITDFSRVPYMINLYVKNGKMFHSKPFGAIVGLFRQAPITYI